MPAPDSNPVRRNTVGAPDPAPAAQGEAGPYYFLGIGIDQYRHWGVLKTAVAGVTAVAEALQEEFGFPAGHCTFLCNAEATRDRIYSTLRHLAQKLPKNASILIFFAGHGHIDDLTNAGSWIPVDGLLPVVDGIPNHNAAASWVSNHDITSLLKVYSARHVLLVSDSCYSGDFLITRDTPAATDAYVRAALGKPSRQALTSGGLHPVSDGGFNGQSVFTHFLLEALRDASSDCILTVDLHRRVYGGVVANARQEPAYGIVSGTAGELGGEFVLLRPRPVDLARVLGERGAELTALQAALERDREAKAAEAAAKAEAEAKLADLERQITELNAQIARPTAPAKGGFREVVALAREKIQQAQALEELRRRQAEEEQTRQAKILRLRQLERQERQRKFENAWAEYQEMMAHPAVPTELRQRLWAELCSDFNVKSATTSPGQLAWDGNGVRPVVPPPPAKATGTKERPFENGLGMRFVPVVTSMDGKESVLFSVWETRVRDYGAYAGAKPGLDMGWKSPGFAQEETHPVVGVSWKDAKGFCAWLTEKERGEGKIGREQEYRLPSDAEWSWAVGIGEAEDRYGKGRSPQGKDEMIGAGSHAYAYPWGKDWPPPKGAGNYYPNLGVDDYAKTSPVGSFAANAQGLHDLGGNVWEWCEDYHDGKNGERVLRGASWSYAAPRFLLSSFRNNYAPGRRNPNFGFRVVLMSRSAC
jgi:hypothetical protein